MLLLLILKVSKEGAARLVRGECGAGQLPCMEHLALCCIMVEGAVYVVLHACAGLLSTQLLAT